jgi:hypothetical protein
VGHAAAPQSDGLPPGRCTLKFHFPEARAGQQNWWLVIENGKVDLCGFDPGYEVNLYVTAQLKAMTAIWMGVSSVRQQLASGRLDLLGDKNVARAMEEWLGLSVFAKEKKRAA